MDKHLVEQLNFMDKYLVVQLFILYVKMVKVLHFLLYLLWNIDFKC